MQALCKLALEPIAETLADPNSYGFRPERSTADAIEQCVTALSRRTCAQWLLEGDIRGCFDNFSHSWLLRQIPMDRAVLRQWLEVGYIDEGSLFETRAGTPQGGVISPGIANMALDGLEAAVHASVGHWRARREAKLNVIRYADDFVVTGASKDVLESQVLPVIRRFLAERGLELSEAENPNHEHNGRVRLPRSERTKVWRPVADQAGEEEHQIFAGEGQGHCQR